MQEEGKNACAPLLNFTRNLNVEEDPDSVYMKKSLNALDPNWKDLLGFFNLDFWPDMVFCSLFRAFYIYCYCCFRFIIQGKCRQVLFVDKPFPVITSLNHSFKPETLT